MQTLRLAGIMVCLGWSLVVPAFGADLATVVPAANSKAAYADDIQSLAEAQQKIGDLTADFDLTIHGGGAKGGAWKAKGKIVLATGRRYRVDYVSPEVQNLVSDGKQRWLYLQKINQVQKQNLPAAGNPREFFLELGGGLADLLQRCQVTQVIKKGETWEYDCRPRAGEALDFQRARIRVEGPMKLPSRVEIDAAKPVVVVLKHVRIHTREALQKGQKGVSDAIFKFTPPADAEVIEPIW